MLPVLSAPPVAAEEPAAEEFSAGEPAADEEEPAAEGAAADEPTAEEKEEPAADDATDESTANGPADGSVAEEPATEEPDAEGPAAEELGADRPGADGPPLDLAPDGAPPGGATNALGGSFRSAPLGDAVAQPAPPLLSPFAAANFASTAGAVRRPSRTATAAASLLAAVRGHSRLTTFMCFSSAASSSGVRPS